MKNIRRLRLIWNAAVVCAGIFLLMPCAFAGRFLTATRYSVGGIANPQFIAAADLNGDGNVDLVTTNFGTSPHPGSTISVLLGKGDGTFQKAVSYPSGGIKPLWIAVGDFNGDGKPDLAVWNTCGLVTCSLPFVQILLNNGDGTFRAGAAYSSSSSASSFGGPLLAGDFNGDGKLDVVVANEGVILLGNGDGTFSRFTTSFSCVPQVVADFNGDGKLDLAGFASNNLVVVLGNGDGTFNQSASYPVNYPNEPGNTPNLAVADANNDGKLDLITAGISVYLGNGDGSFQSAITTQVQASGHIAVADFNGDGKVDVVVQAGFPVQEVLLLLGNGDGSFTVQPYSNDAEASGRMVAADFNKDGKLDLAVLAPFIDNSVDINSVNILLGNKQDTFLAAKIFPGGDLEVAAGDLNGDGRADLVALASPIDNAHPPTVKVLINLGNALFGPPVTVASSAAHVALGDMNGDRMLDIVTANIDGTVSVYLGNGDGSFQSAITTTTSASGPMVVADFNGDGKLDLALTGVVLLGNGDGTFQSPKSFPGGTHMVVGDFNGDGKLDIATIVGSPAAINILLGKGDGTFQPPLQLAGGYSTLFAGDFNGDGKLDLVANAFGGFIVYLGNGDGTFHGSSTLTKTLIVNVADFNGDSKLDLISAATTIGVFYGNGDGTFQSRVVSNAPGFGSGGNGISVVADLNGDSAADLVVAVQTQKLGGGTVGEELVLLNTGGNTVKLASSANPSKFGQAVTFTVTVAATVPGSGTPAGTVQFTDGTTVLATMTLSKGKATSATSSLSVGSHAIRAVYAGNSRFNPKKSAVLTQTVNP